MKLIKYYKAGWEVVDKEYFNLFDALWILAHIISIASFVYLLLSAPFATLFVIGITLWTVKEVVKEKVKSYFSPILEKLKFYAEK